MRLIECVPNFSEGRNARTINEISDAIAQVEGVFLLDVDSNASANRTVMTFVGEPVAVCQAAFQAIARAQSLIDMRLHKGEHPRIGATDVCPFVPLIDTTMADCIELSRLLGERVGKELGIPVYLYANSAQLPERKRLAFVRKGQYERLDTRMRGANFVPDFGPNLFNARSGATAIGARDLLIAFNVNLDTKSKTVAQEVASQIRQARQRFGEDAINQESPPQSGLTPLDEGTVHCLVECTAIGWYIEEYQRAQVSMNIMNFRRTTLHQAFLEVKRLAQEHGVSVTGSEVVGLLPLQPMLETGRFCLFNSKAANTDDGALVDAAAAFLNLSDTRPFEAKRKILDYRLQNLPPLLNMSPTLG